MAIGATYDDQGNYTPADDPQDREPTAESDPPRDQSMRQVGWRHVSNGGWEPVYRHPNGQYYTKSGDDWYSHGDHPPRDYVDGSQRPTGMPGDPHQTDPQAAPTAQTFGDLSAGSESFGGSAPRSSSFDLPNQPQFEFPMFDGPDYQPVAPFQAPSMEQAAQEPGYQFAMDQGRKALENSAAARGTLRTGGTLKDLFSWGNQFGEQNYSNVFDRQRDIWTMGDQQNRDTFAKTYQTARDEYQPRFDAAKLTFADLFDRWRTIVDANSRIATFGAG